jgi:hypothetical protein
MISHEVQFDEAAYRIDIARARVRAGDAPGVLAAVRAVLAAVRAALAAVAGAPYPGVLVEANAAAADAVRSARAGDRERADAALVLLAHLVADMERFESAAAAGLAAR